MRDPNAILHQALVPLLWVAGGIALLAFLVYRIRVWLRDNDDPAASGDELLAEYQEMNRRGELSDEEFRIIKSRFAPRIGRTLRAPDRPRSDRSGEMEKDCRSENDRRYGDDRTETAAEETPNSRES